MARWDGDEDMSRISLYIHARTLDALDIIAADLTGHPARSSVIRHFIQEGIDRRFAEKPYLRKRFERRSQVVVDFPSA